MPSFASPKRAPILKVADLKMHFPVKEGILLRANKFNKAVDGISFEIQPGETLGLVGESGCGNQPSANASPDCTNLRLDPSSLKETTSPTSRVEL